MTFQQLDPPLAVMLAGKGKGKAVAVIDNGSAASLSWVVAIDESGEVHRVENAEVRIIDNDFISHDNVPSDDVQPALFSAGRQSHHALEFPEADADHAAFP